MVEIVQPVPVEGILAARARLSGLAVATPCVRLNSPERDDEIHLKLENLQPIGSFKLRPIGNSVLSKPSATLAHGVYTASSGNSAIAISWMAKRLGIPATVIVTDSAPAGKVEHLRRLGAQIVTRPFERWWREVTEGVFPGIPGVCIDAAREPAALCGNGTIGLEILESLTDIEAIFTPFGSGALACGIACAVRAV
jgi:threonine dehydratase